MRRLIVLSTALLLLPYTHGQQNSEDSSELDFGSPQRPSPDGPPFPRFLMHVPRFARKEFFDIVSNEGLSQDEQNAQLTIWAKAFNVTDEFNTWAKQVQEQKDAITQNVQAVVANISTVYNQLEEILSNTNLTRRDQHDQIRKLGTTFPREVRALFFIARNYRPESRAPVFGLENQRGMMKKPMTSFGMMNQNQMRQGGPQMMMFAPFMMGNQGSGQRQGSQGQGPRFEPDSGSQSQFPGRRGPPGPPGFPGYNPFGPRQQGPDFGPGGPPGGRRGQGPDFGPQDDFPGRQGPGGRGRQGPDFGPESDSQDFPSRRNPGGRRGPPGGRGGQGPDFGPQGDFQGRQGSRRQGSQDSQGSEDFGSLGFAKRQFPRGPRSAMNIDSSDDSQQNGMMEMRRGGQGPRSQEGGRGGQDQQGSSFGPRPQGPDFGPDSNRRGPGGRRGQGPDFGPDFPDRRGPGGRGGRGPRPDFGPDSGSDEDFPGKRGGRRGPPGPPGGRGGRGQRPPGPWGPRPEGPDSDFPDRRGPGGRGGRGDGQPGPFGPKPFGPQDDFPDRRGPGGPPRPWGPRPWGPRPDGPDFGPQDDFPDRRGPGGRGGRGQGPRPVGPGPHGPDFGPQDDFPGRQGPGSQGRGFGPRPQGPPGGRGQGPDFGPDSDFPDRRGGRGEGPSGPFGPRPQGPPGSRGQGPDFGPQDDFPGRQGQGSQGRESGPRPQGPPGPDFGPQDDFPGRRGQGPRQQRPDFGPSDDSQEFPSRRGPGGGRRGPQGGQGSNFGPDSDFENNFPGRNGPSQGGQRFGPRSQDDFQGRQGPQGFPGSQDFGFQQNQFQGQGPQGSSRPDFGPFSQRRQFDDSNSLDAPLNSAPTQKYFERQSSKGMRFDQASGFGMRGQAAQESSNDN